MVYCSVSLYNWLNQSHEFGVGLSVCLANGRQEVCFLNIYKTNILAYFVNVSASEMVNFSF